MAVHRKSSLAESDYVLTLFEIVILSFSRLSISNAVFALLSLFQNLHSTASTQCGVNFALASYILRKTCPCVCVRVCVHYAFRENLCPPVRTLLRNPKPVRLELTPAFDPSRSQFTSTYGLCVLYVCVCVRAYANACGVCACEWVFAYGCVGWEWVCVGGCGCRWVVVGVGV